ncbi:hypothetical protein VIGAN_03146800 [Vigna angularis var. angularis]|uniref:Copia protein n=1 Tax=Vigna angularis var. angularis TaxID=157739 RepID=A0A0S3RM45_PHAAN|nr:hypothetical protein VIGAN_03146800 [Vigna angularis var. angularis]
MHCDNQIILHIASKIVFHEKPKHIENYCHFIHKKLLTKEICTEFVGSNDQLVSVLTKFLGDLRLSLFVLSLVHTLYGLI